MPRGSLQRRVVRGSDLVVGAAIAGVSPSLWVSSWNVGGDLAELVAVLAGVVGAEEQLAARGELDAEVGLGTAPVAAVDALKAAELGATAVVTSASFLFHSVHLVNVGETVKVIPVVLR